MTRRDAEQRPTRDRSLLGFRVRSLDLIHNGATFLRRRGLEHERIGGVLLHRIDAPDPGMDLHDHPWPFVTIVLRGGYTDEAADARHACERAADAETVERAMGARPGEMTRGERRVWRRWSVHTMPLVLGHRIVSAQPGTVTLVLRRPKVRTWGFYTPEGWVSWEDYDYDARRPCGVESNHPEERR